MPDNNIPPDYHTPPKPVACMSPATFGGGRQTDDLWDQCNDLRRQVNTLQGERSRLREALAFVKDALSGEQSINGSGCNCEEKYLCVACGTTNALELAEQVLIEVRP